MISIKRCMFCIFGLYLFLFPLFRLTADTEVHGRSIDQIIAEIEEKQNVDTISRINPDRVSVEHLEELGDAVMDIMLQDRQQHEWMDQMMGGDGSEQLASMHRFIGYRYLQNDGDLTSGLWGPGMPGYGMMGPGMMGSRQWNNGWYGLRGPDRISEWFIPWIVIFFLIVLIAVSVLVIVLSKSKKSHRLPGTSGSPDEIIRLRYAAGEITREEYLQKINDLKKP